MSVKIIIDGDGLSFKGETSILKASQVISFLSIDQSNELSLNLSTSSSPLKSLPGQNKSPREVLIDTNAKTNAQKILVFAKYHYDLNNVEEFDSTAIRSYFKRSGESEPRNFSRDINDAIKLGYIYESDNKGFYKITDTGKSQIETGFSLPAKAKSTRRTNTKSKTGNSEKKPPSAIDNLTVVPKLESITPYHALKVKGDKILWILYFAYKNDIPELMAAEIAQLAGKLLDNIPAKNVFALTEGAQKRAYIAKTPEGKFKLLHDGITFIENMKSE